MLILEKHLIFWKKKKVPKYAVILLETFVYIHTTTYIRVYVYVHGHEPIVKHQAVPYHEHRLHHRRLLVFQKRVLAERGVSHFTCILVPETRIHLGNLILRITDVRQNFGQTWTAEIVTLLIVPRRNATFVFYLCDRLLKIGLQASSGIHTILYYITYSYFIHHGVSIFRIGNRRTEKLSTNGTVVSLVKSSGIFSGVSNSRTIYEKIL